MKTILRIPFKPAKEDPSWLLKAHSGRKMDAIEVEEYMLYMHEKEHNQLVNDFIMIGVPGQG